MSMREGRGRPRRDYPSRSEDKPYHGRGSNPRSRHLWVGNLPHNLTESDVARYFLHFGELESVAFQLGRCYAFINYRHEEDAFAAIKELQGFVIEGNPLRIEFAKAEKSSIPARDVDFSERRDNPHPRGRGSPFSGRDSRARHSSPELSHSSKSKTSDKNAEPSEVLWIGFPAQLKVDEFVLRKVFSPFGDIEKITTFPGRTYAFVRFRDLTAACRAKETLQGKLFGNPRVHICFAKSDSGTSNRERNSINSPPSPHTGAYGRKEHYEPLRSEKNFDRISGEHSIRSPPYAPIPDRGDRNMRNTGLWPVGNDFHEQRRSSGQGPELGSHANMYDHPNSPPRNIKAHIRDFSPEGFPHRGPIYDDPWDLPEDVSILHGAKRLKTETYSSDTELPEYPLSDLVKSKRIPSHDVPQSGLLDNNHDSRHSGYRAIPERLMNTNQPFVGRGDHWNVPEEEFHIPMPIPPLSRRKLTPDLRGSSSKEVWRWEGMIAKGGTTVCRTRCFPVGKPPDMVLPEILDCTARTSLDMLADHYYQASSAWVVFLAPADDPDISYYNEFMNYLGDKQRAAVVKLDERSTLFLVPPSEFSQKVLKVPGNMSISGVILRSDPPGSSYGSRLQKESRESSFASFQNDSVYPKPVSPSGRYLPLRPPLTSYETPGASAHIPGPVRANWSPHDLQNSNHRDIVSNPPTVSMGHPGDQLAQLASSVLGQQGQLSGASGSGEYKPSGNINLPGHQYSMSQDYYGSSSDQMPSEMQKLTPNLVASKREAQLLQISERDEPDADPQKRLEATLQLAAALIQQIQQGKGT